jgi:hypothetical protein
MVSQPVPSEMRTWTRCFDTSGHGCCETYAIFARNP